MKFQQDHRGERRGGGDRDRVDDSRSTQDSNWRKGETTSSGSSSRPMGAGGPPFPPRDRQPMRERTEVGQMTFLPSPRKKKIYIYMQKFIFYTKKIRNL